MNYPRHTAVNITLGALRCLTLYMHISAAVAYLKRNGLSLSNLSDAVRSNNLQDTGIDAQDLLLLLPGAVALPDELRQHVGPQLFQFCKPPTAAAEPPDPEHMWLDGSNLSEMVRYGYLHHIREVLVRWHRRHSNPNNAGALQDPAFIAAVQQYLPCVDFLSISSRSLDASQAAGEAECLFERLPAAQRAWLLGDIAAGLLLQPLGRWAGWLCSNSSATHARSLHCLWPSDRKQILNNLCCQQKVGITAQCLLGRVTTTNTIVCIGSANALLRHSI